MDLVYVNKENYDNKINIQGSSCLFYSNKAMKKLYPNGDFIIAGSIGKGLKKKIGELHHRNKILDYYANNYSRIRFKMVGYIAVDENRYLEVVKPKGLQRMLLFLSLVLLLLVSLTFLLSGSDIDPLAKDYVPENGMLAETNPDHIALPTYERIILKAGTDTAYVALYNPENNPCYFKFIVYLNDDNSQIYESGLVSPGQAITNVKFNQEFQEGVYPIKIKIESYSLENKEPLNNGLNESTLVAIEE